MSGFEEKISEILSNPDSMEQIMALAKSLEGGKPAGAGGDSKGSPPFPPIDPKMMEILTNVMREYGKEDKTVAALGAIKPFLKEEKQDRVDKAMEMAKLAKIAKLALGSMNHV